MTTIAPLTLPLLGCNDLWQHIYGDQEGLIATFSGQRVAGVQDLQATTSRYFQWPSHAEAAVRWLNRESNRGRDAYICGHLVTDHRRVKPNAAKMLALYVDGDGAEVPATCHSPQPACSRHRGASRTTGASRGQSTP